MMIRIKTKSSLFIDGTPQTFEIGGIDLHTAVDYANQPFIPASSFKGALREIVRDTANDEIKNYYQEYIQRGKEAFETSVATRSDRDKSFIAVYDDILKNASAEYLFGIGGFNNTPKLIFSDFLLQDAEGSKHDLFSIDMKNSIEGSGKTISSNPRTYKVARQGLTFAGSIEYYRFDSNEIKDIIQKYLIECFDHFNAGVYRIGNSKSRGYGWIHVECAAQEAAK